MERDMKFNGSVYHVVIECSVTGWYRQRINLVWKRPWRGVARVKLCLSMLSK